MPSIALSDIEVGYREAGSGEPLVFVHGLGQDSSSWQVQLDHVGNAHRFAPDVRGHGNTTLGAAEGTLAQLAGDLCAFLETVTGPAACVGFSMGGTIVLAAAVARPDLLTRAVLLGTSSVVGRAAASFYERRAAEATDRAALVAGLRQDTAAGLYRAHDVDALVAERIQAVGDGAGLANAARAMARVAGEPLTPRLAEIAVPVTVVGAEHDTMCPRKAADIMLAALPSAEYVEIAASGHLMNVDDPSAVTAAVVAAIGRTR